MIPSYGAAVKYAYSSSRTRAMRAKLLTAQQMRDIIASKSISNILAILMQSDYANEIVEYGGMEIKSDLVDFALSKNMAEHLSKLIAVTPSDHRDTILAITAKWGLYNIKLALGAKARKQQYSAIEKYVIDYGRYNPLFIKEVMREPGVEEMLTRMMINSPYKKTLEIALQTFRETRNADDAISAIDREHYTQLGLAAKAFMAADHEAAELLKMEVDTVNVLSLIRAKKMQMPTENAMKNIVPYGKIDAEALKHWYNETNTLQAFVNRITSFDLKSSLEAYAENKRLLSFEIGLRNGLFKRGLEMLGHTVLSFSNILAYIYLKELEVYTLRISINGKSYGLTQEELERLMVWKA